MDGLRDDEDIGDECDAEDEEIGKCVKVDVLRCKVWYDCIRSIVSTSDYIAVRRKVGVVLYSTLKFSHDYRY